jgi:hypothetical protein
VRSSWLGLAALVAALLSGSFQRVAAQDVEQASESKKSASLSTELRFRFFTTSYRWSSYRSGAMDLPDSGKQSLYVVPALGLRFYPKNGHGALVDVDYRFDVDADGNAEFLCIFDCPPRMWTEFVVAHAGYAYRYLIRTAREPGRLAWTLTPHASVAAGASYTQRTSPFSQREQSAVVGARFGLDIDLHINRFFMGWTLRYEVLKHTKGSLRLSHFVSWNVIPIFAIGAVIGRKVRAPVP